MISFAYPPGLLLLLLIPLVILFRRRRSEPRRQLLAPFFLLLELRPEPPGKSLRLLRLSRSQRLLLLALMIGCLACAIAGTRVYLRRAPPERWLLVVDNTPLSTARFDGVPMLETLRQFLLTVTAGALPGDTITVLTTSPTPVARTFAPGARLAEHLRALAAAPSSATVEESLSMAADLAKRHQKAVLYSPRASLWRRRAGQAPARKLVIPEDAKTATGNRGFVQGRIRANPEREGSYDIYLVARSSPPDSGRLPVSLAHNGRELSAPPAIELRQGEGSIFVPGVALEPGVLDIALPAGDAYSLDDRISAKIPELRPVSIALHGEHLAVYEDAVGAGEIFRLATGSAGEVDLYLGQAPESLARPTLVIAPSRDQLGLRFQQLIAVRGEVRWNPDHPVTAPLRFGALRPEQVLAFDFPKDYESLAAVDGVPLVLAGERDGRRILFWLFDPLENGLFLKPEFVILLRESLAWLAGRGEVPTTPALDGPATAQAAAIGLPALEAKLFARGATAERLIVLDPYLMSAALLLGLYLGLADTFGPEEEPS